MKIVTVLVLCGAMAVAGHGQNRTAATDLVNAQELVRDLQILSADDMQGRQPGTPGHEKAQAYIVRRFREAGIAPFRDSYVESFTRPAAGANVVGYVKGKLNPDRYIVVTAHYDHLGVRNGNVYNGADDNASGVAGLIATAKHFATELPDHSIIFAAVDLEEVNMGGVRHLVTNPPSPKDSIVLNVNLDMLARDEKNTLYAAGAHHYPFLKPYLELVAMGAPVKLLLGHDDPLQRGMEDWTEMSDHVWFHRNGIPFVYFGVEDYEHHHEPTDDFGNITRDFFVNAVRTVIQSVRQFDVNLDQIARRQE